ncbi:MAG: hypothetical protein AAGM36_17705 [Cyanobacteria bacterium J06597_1]
MTAHNSDDITNNNTNPSHAERWSMTPEEVEAHDKEEMKHLFTGRETFEDRERRNAYLEETAKEVSEAELLALTYRANQWHLKKTHPDNPLVRRAAQLMRKTPNEMSQVMREIWVDMQPRRRRVRYLEDCLKAGMQEERE